MSFSSSMSVSLSEWSSSDDGEFSVGVENASFTFKMGLLCQAYAFGKARDLVAE